MWDLSRELFVIGSKKLVDFIALQQPSAALTDTVATLCQLNSLR